MLGCNCCNTTKRIGCFRPCDTLEIGIDAETTGTHTLRVFFGAAVIDIQAEFQSGDPLAFPLDTINENYTYSAALYGPDGAMIPIVNGGTFDCVTFSVTPNIL